MPGRGQRHELGGVPVIVVENVQDYRDCVPYYVNKDDVCLELGCAQGCTTAVLAEHAKEVVGVDKSAFNFKVAEGRYKHIEFHEIAAEDISALLRLGKRFTKIFLDISGSQPVGPLAALIEKYERAFPDVTLFVVKAYRLKKLVGLSTVFPEEVLGTTRNPSTAFMIKAAAGAGGEGGGGVSGGVNGVNGVHGGLGAGRNGRSGAGGRRRSGLGGLLRLHAGGMAVTLAAFGAGLVVGRASSRR